MSGLKLGVVGVGALGRHHARILSELPNVELVAVADCDAERGRAVADQWQTQFVPDPGSLIGTVDAVVIAVPTKFHLQTALPFLEQSLPVLVEKPLALDLSEAEQLVAAAEANDALLQVGHIEQFNPATIAARPLCGQPKYIRCERVSPYPFRSMDIGVVHDLMIHDLDLILSLVEDDVHDVSAFGIGLMGAHEDCVQARVTFQGGCVADLTASRVSPVAARTMQVWSAGGTVTIDFTSREIVAYRPSEMLRYGTSPVERAQQAGADIEQLKQDVFGKFLNLDRPIVPQTDALTAELQDFVDCVQCGRAPRVGGTEALKAMRLAEDVLESVAGHQWDGHAAGPIGPQPVFPVLRRMAG